MRLTRYNRFHRFNAAVIKNGPQGQGLTESNPINEGRLLFYPHLDLASGFLIKGCQVEYELWQTVVAIILFGPKF